MSSRQTDEEEIPDHHVAEIEEIEDDPGEDMSTIGTYVKKRFQPPGTLTYTGEHATEKSVMSVIEYDGAGLNEFKIEDTNRLQELKDSKKICWLNLDGLSDISVIERIGEVFKIHPLILEDILHTSQRPKFEDCGDYIFIVLKMLTIDDKGGIDTEQVSFVIGEKILITFQETSGDVFDTVRARIRHSKGHVRKMGSDYLAYTLIDSVVDNYFLILEHLGEQTELMEDQILVEFDEKTVFKIHAIKRQLISLRRSIWPLREVISMMERGGSTIIAKRTHIYLRDLYDNTIQVMDMVESLRDMSGGLLDTYLSAVSNRMNSVMKVLTIIATIFIPLTFIAGVYGMNFQHMPELDHPMSYPGVLALMLFIAVTMLMWFKKKKWL